MKPCRALKELLGIDAPDDYLNSRPELGRVALDEETALRLRTAGGPW